MFTYAVKFDGHCPSRVEYDRPTIRKFQGMAALVHHRNNGRYDAEVLGCVSCHWPTARDAIQAAATLAANIQIDVTTTYSR